MTWGVVEFSELFYIYIFILLGKKYRKLKSCLRWFSFTCFPTERHWWVFFSMQFSAKCLAKCKPRPRVFDNIASEYKKRLKWLFNLKQKTWAVYNPTNELEEKQSTWCMRKPLKLNLCVHFLLLRDFHFLLVSHLMLSVKWLPLFSNGLCEKGRVQMCLRRSRLDYDFNTILKLHDAT